MSLTVFGCQASAFAKHSITSSLTAVESFWLLALLAKSKARGAGGAAKDRCADEAGNDRDADESGTDQDADKQTKQTESLPVRGERVIVCL